MSKTWHLGLAVIGFVATISFAIEPTKFVAGWSGYILVIMSLGLFVMEKIEDAFPALRGGK